MEKLKLEHLAPYLPYGLKCYTFEDNTIFIEEIKQIDIQNRFIETKCGVLNEIEKFIPILRPLSDLTKEIEINEFPFIPILELARKFHSNSNGYEVTHYEKPIKTFKWYRINCCVEGDSDRYMYYQINLDMQKNQHRVIEKLFEWHFDVFGLIEKGLAIDINTLNK